MKINFNDYKIQKRSIKSGLKKIDMEELYKDSNIYDLEKIGDLIKYLHENGSDSIKMSILSLLSDIKKNKEETLRKLSEREAQRILSKHVIKNVKYPIKDEVLEIANRAIYENQITKEYEIYTGYSLVSKDYAVRYAVKRKKLSEKSSIIESIQRVLKMYSSILRHMNEEEISIDVIAGRYVFPESLEICDLIREIFKVESMEV